jgi:hypothetical protein
MVAILEIGAFSKTARLGKRLLLKLTLDQSRSNLPAVSPPV